MNTIEVHINSAIYNADLTPRYENEKQITVCEMLKTAASLQKDEETHEDKLAGAELFFKLVNAEVSNKETVSLNQDTEVPYLQERLKLMDLHKIFHLQITSILNNHPNPVAALAEKKAVKS